MKVIDARTGKEMAIGETVNYGDGEIVTLQSVTPGILTAEATVMTTHRDRVTGKLVTQRQSVPLDVRWTHPKFFLQHVAFLPS